MNVSPVPEIVSQPPAPWTVEYDGELLDVDHGPEARWPWRIVDAAGETVVDFTGGSDVSEDVAHLIAAAPALLEALQEIGSLASSATCAIGHKSKQRFIRLIAGAADRALAAVQAPREAV